ncbi:hypothetical protein VTN31DRAFT_4865 [Thermomyces dupontii]|uniref:uncharacterized protein n=1 Tax=Talaromyces thermophilus TaxID=28565 RepID=UPI0037428BA4
MTNVDGKWYPRELHRWDDFENEHYRIYNMFLEELSNKQLFPSHTQVAAIGSSLLESPQQVELDVQPYVHGAIESPVRQVVEAYLRQMGNMDKLSFRNTGHSLDQKDNVSAEDERSHPRNKSSDRSSARRIPDRWCMRESADGGTVEPIFLGEYKPARKLRAETIAQVLASPPSDLFFQVLRRKKFGRVDSKETNEEIVAKALGQTFDYMIRSGLLYGYLSSGHSLILLKIEESAAWKLFFHYTPVTSVGDFEARRSPIAQLATLAMLTLRSGGKPAQWIRDAEKCLIKWPYTPSDHIPSDELRRLREHGGIQVTRVVSRMIQPMRIMFRHRRFDDNQHRVGRRTRRVASVAGLLASAARPRKTWRIARRHVFSASSAASLWTRDVPILRAIAEAWPRRSIC